MDHKLVYRFIFEYSAKNKKASIEAFTSYYSVPNLKTNSSVVRL